MAHPLDRDTVVRMGERVDDFLRDPAVMTALDRLEAQYIEDMIAADESAQRAKMQGKIVALRDLKTELRAMVGSAVHEMLSQVIEEKRAAYLQREGLLKS